MTKIFTRIGGAVIVATVLACFVAFIGMAQIGAISGDMDGLIGQDLATALALTRSQGELQRMSGNIAPLLSANAGADQIKALIASGMKGYANRLAETAAASPRGADEAAALAPGLAALQTSAERVTALAANGLLDRARDALSTEFAPLAAAQMSKSRELTDANWTALGDAGARAAAAAGHRRWIMLAVMLLPIAFAGAAVFWLWKNIEIPLACLLEAAGAIRAGDTSTPVTELDRPDEIGGIASALEKLRLETLRAAHVGRKIVEEEKQAASTQLSDLSDAALEGIAICSDGKVTEANTSLAAMLDATRADIAGTSAHALFRGEDGTYLDEFLERADGKPISGLLMAGDGPRPMEIRARRLVGHNGSVSTIVTTRTLREQRAAEERLRFLAYHDQLTGLGNSSLLAARVRHAVALSRRTKERVSALYLEVNDFAAVNDHYGQAIGDALLRQVADRLDHAVRETDFVARIGTADFVVLQAGYVLAEGADVLVRRLTAAIAEPFDLGEGRVASLTASIGVAVHSDPATDGGDLVALARAALEPSATANRATAIFEPGVDADLRRRAALESDLKTAISAGQFSLAFQPRADTASGEITCFAALPRWTHPGQGVIAPEEFIPMAEASGCIVQLGGWLLHAACAEAAKWDVPLRVAVKISPRQIERRDFAALAEKILAETGLDPVRLDLEFTEAAIFRDAPLAMETLSTLKALGANVVLDDFGTGASSLATLGSFAFDAVKLSPKLVGEMCDDRKAAAIVRAILSVARETGIAAIGDGVETDSQRALLKAEGCVAAQGHLIGKPLPVEVFEFVTSPNRRRPKAIHAA